MFKNTASQKIAVYAHDTNADAAKTGDAANITAYVSKDGGAAAASDDTNPTELDATNLPGVYVFDLTQAETNCDLFVLVAQSGTANIQIDPVIAYTETTAATLASQVAANTSDGVTWENVLKYLLAYAKGVQTKSGNDVLYKAQDGSTTLWTGTWSSSGRSIS